jgi:hypothetical protein
MTMSSCFEFFNDADVLDPAWSKNKVSGDASRIWICGAALISGLRSAVAQSGSARYRVDES